MRSEGLRILEGTGRTNEEDEWGNEMKIKINDSLIICGTPEEMVEFIRLYDAPKEKEEKKPAEEKPKGRAKRIDWPKVEALKNAGWKNKDIAEEIGCNAVTIGNHFRDKGAGGKGMNGQMTIFDLLCPERIKPVEEVARIASPYWTTSRQKLIDLCNTDPGIKTFAKAVRHEYCPYGAFGQYCDNGRPNELVGYDMRSNLIKIAYRDGSSKRVESVCSWEDFARELSMMIWAGEYKE